jgi:two-component system chemotaxis response regulator CheB
VTGKYGLIVIGCSWGGLEALAKILAPLPATFNTPIVAAQHRSPRSEDGSMTKTLSNRISLPVQEVDDKDVVERGRVYLAPPDYHLLIEGNSFALSVDEKVQYSRPSIDVLFESAADSFHGAVIAVVLTGANQDGAAGMKMVKEKGGTTIVQDPASAERSEMPAAAIATGAADMVLSLSEISGALMELTGSRVLEERRS